MNRTLLLLPLLLILAVGGWFAFTLKGSGDSQPIAPPIALAGDTSRETISLPVHNELLSAGDPAGKPKRDALNRPLLSLLTRRATDGSELELAQAIIEPVDAETPVLTVQTRTSDSPPTELDPGSWRVTFEADGYVSQTRQIDLALGDEERLEVSLVRGALVTGQAQDRFGRPLAGQKIFFLEPGQSHPRFPREAEGILSTSIDREGKIEPIWVPPGMYSLNYGNLGTPKLEANGRFSAGETTDLLIVYGGRNVVRFELDRLPEEGRRLEVRLEEQDKERLERDQQRLLDNPERAAKLQQKNKRKERWRTRGQTRIEAGVGAIHRARPGVYRVTLVAKPGEYSSELLLELKEDESVLVRIQTPQLPDRSGNRRADPRVPKEGPLNITILRDPPDPANKPNGIYWP